MQAKRRGTAGRWLPGAIALAASLSPAVAAAQTITPLRVGQTVNGALAQTDPTANQHGRFKVYSFTGREGQRLSIRMSSPEFDTYLSVGRTVAGITDYMKSDDDGGAEGENGGTNSRLRFRVPANGQYLLVAQAFGDDATGSYTLSLDTMARPVVRPPRAISMGQPQSGALEETDPTLEEPEDVFYDLYTFQGRAGQRVQVSMDAGFDAYLDVGRMQGDEMEVLESNDDAPGVAGGDGEERSTNSRLRWTVPANGQYVIRARSLGAGATGAYTVRLEERAAPGPAPAPRPITNGFRLNGNLEESDPQSEDDSYYDAYVYRGRAGEKLTIVMRSDDFDTFVVLGRVRNGVFEQIETMDDGDEEGTNTRMEITLPEDGEYVIRANSLTAESTGSYSILVQSSQ